VDITGGFSIGDGVTFVVVQNGSNSVDILSAKTVKFSFVAGHSCSWENGGLFPDSTSFRVEYGYVGTTFTGPSYLAQRMVANQTTAGDLDDDFDNAQAYYVALSQNFALEDTNVDVSSQWSGIFFNCTEESDRYVANVDASLLNAATWYSVEPSCQYGATWIINVVGTDDVTFQGGDFPGIIEKVIYNIVGTGRTITSTSGVVGNVLSPSNTFSQTGGVTRGIVIASDIPNYLSGTNPDCESFLPFEIIVQVNGQADAGSSQIPVASFSQLINGDTIDTGTGSTQVVGRLQDGDQSYLQVNPPTNDNLGSGSFISTTVANPALPRTQSNITVVQSSKSGGPSSIPAFVISLTVLSMLLLALF